MKLVPYTNSAKTVLHIGGKAINPGETREVDARFVPAAPSVNVLLQVLFFNTATEPRFFDTVRVDPGEHARVSANFFVDPNTPADSLQSDLFRHFLDEPIKFITPRLGTFTDEELAVLERMETEGGDKRKGVLEAIENELAVRVAEAEFSAEDYQEALKAKSDEELDVELLAVTDDEVKLPLVQEELAARKAAKE